MADELKIDIDDSDDDDEFNRSMSDMIRNRRASRMAGSGALRRRRRKSSAYRSATSGNEEDEDSDEDEMKMYGEEENESEENAEDEVDEKERKSKKQEAQDKIFENIQIQKDIMTNLKSQPWRMKKKLKALRLARGYVEKCEGRLSKKDNYKVAVAKVFIRFRRVMWEFLMTILPWEMRIKLIESHFGTLVSSYFTFVRWVFLINFFHAVVISCMIILPELLIGEPYGTPQRKSIPEQDLKLAQNLDKLWAFEGFLKYSPIFYGYYGKQNKPYKGYRLPLMYLLVNVVVIAYTLVAILRRMASNSRMNKSADKDEKFTFSWRVYTSWDFMMGNKDTANNKKASIMTSIREAILEDKEKQKKKEKNNLQTFLRVVANILVLLVLAGSAYLVYSVVDRAAKTDRLKLEEPEKWEKTVGFWQQNEVSIVMSLITQIYPSIFDLIGLMEKYHPRIALQWQLMRILALYFLNLYTLIISLKTKIDAQLGDWRKEVAANLNRTCKNMTTTRSPTTDATPTPCTYTPDMSKAYNLCWETMVGQEMVKVTVMDLVMTAASIIIIDFLRGLFVRYANQCWCWDLELKFPEYGEFKIAENILHIINNQGMIWMGTFFAPGLPVMNIFKLVVLVYMRAWAVMMCNIPHEVVFKIGSNNFYFAILLLMLFVCFLPTGYAIVGIRPSPFCGPFSRFDKMHFVITDFIDNEFPDILKTIVYMIASPAIIIPTIVLLIMLVYYLLSLVKSLREINEETKEMLIYERTEEKKKIYAMADARQKGGSDIPSSIVSKKFIPVVNGGLDLNGLSPTVINTLLKLSSNGGGSKQPKLKSLVKKQIDVSRDTTTSGNRKLDLKAVVDKEMRKDEHRPNRKANASFKALVTNVQSSQNKSKANNGKLNQTIRHARDDKTNPPDGDRVNKPDRHSKETSREERLDVRSSKKHRKRTHRTAGKDGSSTEDDEGMDHDNDSDSKNKELRMRNYVNYKKTSKTKNTTENKTRSFDEKRTTANIEIVISPGDAEDSEAEQFIDKQMVKVLSGNKEKLVDVDNLKNTDRPSPILRTTPIAVVKGKQMAANDVRKLSQDNIRNSTNVIDEEQSSNINNSVDVAVVEDVELNSNPLGTSLDGSITVTANVGDESNDATTNTVIQINAMHDQEAGIQTTGASRKRASSVSLATCSNMHVATPRMSLPVNGNISALSIPEIRIQTTEDEDSHEQNIQSQEETEGNGNLLHPSTENRSEHDTANDQSGPVGLTKTNVQKDGDEVENIRPSPIISVPVPNNTYDTSDSIISNAVTDVKDNNNAEKCNESDSNVVNSNDQLTKSSHEKGLKLKIIKMFQRKTKSRKESKIVTPSKVGKETGEERKRVRDQKKKLRDDIVSISKKIEMNEKKSIKNDKRSKDISRKNSVETHENFRIEPRKSLVFPELETHHAQNDFSSMLRSRPKRNVSQPPTNVQSPHMKRLTSADNFTTKETEIEKRQRLLSEGKNKIDYTRSSEETVERKNNAFRTQHGTIKAKSNNHSPSSILLSLSKVPPREQSLYRANDPPSRAVGWQHKLGDRIPNAISPSQRDRHQFGFRKVILSPRHDTASRSVYLQDVTTSASQDGRNSPVVNNLNRSVSSQHYKERIRPNEMSNCHDIHGSNPVPYRAQYQLGSWNKTPQHSHFETELRRVNDANEYIHYVDSGLKDVDNHSHAADNTFYHLRDTYLESGIHCDPKTTRHESPNFRRYIALPAIDYDEDDEDIDNRPQIVVDQYRDEGVDMAMQKCLEFVFGQQDQEEYHTLAI